MNTRHAQLVLTTLQAGSFTAAAHSLHITQPTLSQTIKQIENQLGAAIFMRGKTPLTLTPAGELYVQAARRILLIESRLSESVALLQGRHEGSIRMGVMLHRSCELLPYIFADFSRAFPNVRLEVTEGSVQELTQSLLRSEIDMAFFPDGARHAKLEYRQIAADEIVLLAGRQTALGRRIPSGSTISLREAQDELFVQPTENLFAKPHFDELFATIGFQPRIAITCDNVETAKRICGKNQLVMLSPYVSHLSDGFAMQQLAHYHLGAESFLPPLCMAYAREQPLSASMERLCTLMSNRFRAMTAYRE